MHSMVSTRRALDLDLLAERSATAGARPDLAVHEHVAARRTTPSMPTSPGGPTPRGFALYGDCLPSRNASRTRRAARSLDDHRDLMLYAPCRGKERRQPDLDLRSNPG